MSQAEMTDSSDEGWGWFAADTPKAEEGNNDALARSFARCFGGSDGVQVLAHLRRTISDRRLGPDASDAELRFLEGQRSVAAHIISMVDRGRA